MNIGIVTDKNTEDAVVAPTLEGGGYLIVVDTEKMAVLTMLKNQSEGRDFPKALKDYDCEAIVCGTIQAPVFEEIAAAQITRYNGYGLDIGTAAECAHFDTLPLITAFEGGKSCREDDKHDECECGADE